MSSQFFYPQSLPIEHLDKLAELLRNEDSSPWAILKTASVCVGFLSEYYDGWPIPEPEAGPACEAFTRMQLADEIDRFAGEAQNLLAGNDAHEQGSPGFIRGVLPVLAWIIESSVAPQ